MFQAVWAHLFRNLPKPMPRTAAMAQSRADSGTSFQSFAYVQPALQSECQYCSQVEDFGTQRVMTIGRVLDRGSKLEGSKIVVRVAATDLSLGRIANGFL